MRLAVFFTGKRSALVACTLLVVTTFCISAFAQRTTGTLRGQILDPQGAVVPSAKVTVTNQATGVDTPIASSSSGVFDAPSLIPGKYTVTVEATGFKKYVRKDVNVSADQINQADVRLDVGAASETVEVTSGTAEVQTNSATLANTYSSQDVLSLPNAGGVLNGSPLNLAVLAPNVVAQPGGVTGMGGSVGGTRPRDNNFTVDGVDDNNLGVTGANSTVIPDAVAEFSLQTNQFSAEYGHSAGGQFNLVTKTGTNAWHGSGEEYFQNRNLNAMDNLTKTAISQGTIPGQPNYDNNRFGGTIGGPIVRNKWFIFGGYEYTTLHGQGNTTTMHAPTAAGLATLQSMAVDSAIKNVLQNYPTAPAADLGTLPVTSGAITNNIPIGNLILVSPVFQREHDTIINSDYTLGNHQLGARFLLNQESFILPVNSTQAQFNQNEPIHSRKIALTDTWTINQHWVNDLKVQYSYYSLGLTNPCGSTCPPDVTIDDLGDTTVGPADVQSQKQNTYQIVDNVSWLHGRHTFKFGGQFSHYIYPQFFLPRSFGDNWYTSTSELINDQIPSVPGRTLRGAGSGSFLGTQSATYLFAQDDIKVTPRFTLNLGLRYEYWTNPVGGETQALNAISNVPGVITFAKPKTDTNNFGPRIGFAFDPTGNGRTSIRGGFGISYDVKFQNFASITLPPQIQSELNPASACTLTPLPTWCASGATPNKNFLLSGGLPQTFVPPTTVAGSRALTTSFIDDTVMPKILTWSLGVQHEFYRNSLFEVRYVGTRGISLPVQFRRNHISAFDAGITPLPTFFRASDVPATYNASTPDDTAFNNFNSNIYSAFGFKGNVTADPPAGSSIYHALSANFTQRSRFGLTFNTNYTYAHTIDNSTNEFFTSLLNPRRSEDTVSLRNDRADSDLDVRHKFALSAAYELPKVKTANVFARIFLNGYQLGSVFLAQTGQPVTIQSGGGDANGNGDTAGDRAVLNPFGTKLAGSDVIPVCKAATASGATFLASDTFGNGGACPGATLGYLAVDPTARFVFAGPDVRTNIGRNSFRSPGFGVLNFSIFKNTSFAEGKYLQIRLETFNVLNHRNFTVSNANIFSTAGVTAATSNPGYVQVTDPSFLNPKIFSGGNRQVTLGLKVVF
jgi:outer membrane receptor protein involved in Fe transport